MLLVLIEPGCKPNDDVIAAAPAVTARQLLVCWLMAWALCGAGGWVLMCTAVRVPVLCRLPTSWPTSLSAVRASPATGRRSVQAAWTASTAGVWWVSGDV